LSLGDGLQRGVRPAEAPDLAQADAEPADQADASGALEREAVPVAREPAIVIEVRRRKLRGGRPPSKEQYPFGTIPVSSEVDGCIEGQSFLIPYEDAPKKRIAAGRKRHKADGKRFFTASEDDGVRVWRTR
jgi:hypothetical protein